jgi:hypothetical protein
MSDVQVCGIALVYEYGQLSVYEVKGSVLTCGSVDRRFVNTQPG